MEQEGAMGTLRTSTPSLPWWSIPWLGTLLSMQGTQVPSLGQEDLTGHEATQPSSIQPVLSNKRSHHNEKPTRHKQG